MSRLAILMIFSVVTAPVTAAPFQDDEQTVDELLQQAAEAFAAAVGEEVVFSEGQPLDPVLTRSSSK